ncbi:MAG TPA: hypothetical protein VNA16_04675 [Abditibacteriaceae bacterium]|nr:hypothetical protein [Abditibacteriaceae bacterium]
MKLVRGWKTLASMIVCLALVGCATLAVSQSTAQQPAAETSVKVRQYFGAKVVSVLSEATRVEAFRVDPKSQQDWPNGQAHEINAESAAKLASVLLDEKTYRWEAGKPIGLRCIFEPAVAYRFWKGKESVSVLVCFKCGEVSFIPDNADDKGNPWYRAIAAKLRPEIMQLTKQTFPDDQVIQALKD